MRVGIGYDVHRLGPGRKLILGGVEIPFEFGLVGHSDADVLSHAVIDALLGAANLGDIGTWFPDSDPKWKGASSLDLLARVLEELKNRQLKVGHVDSVIIAEAPKLRPFMDKMKANLAKVLEVRVEQISIKATTTEGLGAVGKKEGMAAQAIALLNESSSARKEHVNR